VFDEMPQPLFFILAGKKMLDVMLEHDMKINFFFGYQIQTPKIKF
jgi:hypothetical protein